MNDQKPKFYKRWWFLLLAGAVGGLVLAIAVVFFLAFPQYVSPFYWVKQATNQSSLNVVSAPVVSIFQCSASPASLTLPRPAYDPSNNAPVVSVKLKNLDDKPHAIGATGVVGSITLPARGTQSILVSGNMGGTLLSFHERSRVKLSSL